MPKKKKEESEDKKEVNKLIRISQSDFEKEVIELGKKGLTSEKIGEFLKKEGIHSKDFEKKISKILNEKNLYLNPDLKNVEEKLKKIEAQIEKNKQDKRAIREKTRIFSRLRRIKRYLGIPIK